MHRDRDYVPGRPVDMPEARRGGIGAGFEHTDKLLSALLEEINMLDDKLSGVLLPPGPPQAQGSTGNVPMVAPARCAVADSIESFNDRLQSLAGRVRYIASRVDL